MERSSRSSYASRSPVRESTSSQITKLDSANYDLHRKVESLEKELFVVKQQFDLQRDELDTVLRSNGRLIEDIQENCEMVNQQSNEIHTLQGMFVGAKRKHDKMERDLNSAMVRLGNVLRDNQKLRRSETAYLKAEKREKELRGRLRERRAEINELKRERELWCQERIKFTNELEEVNGRLKISEGFLSEKHREVQVCQAALSLEENKLKTLQEDLQRGDLSLQNSARGRIKSLTDTLSTMEREKERLSQDCEGKTKLLQMQKEKLEESQRRIKMLQNSGRLLEAKVREKEKEIQDLSKERDLVVKALESVKLAVELEEKEDSPVMEENLKELTEHMKHFMSDKVEMVSELQKEVAQERTRVEAVRRKWKVAKRKLETAEKTIAKQRKLSGRSGCVAVGERRKEETAEERGKDVSQLEYKDSTTEMDKVRLFLKNLQRISGFSKDPHTTLEAQLDKFSEFLAHRLVLMTTFCNLVKSMEEGFPVPNNGTISASKAKDSLKATISASKTITFTSKAKESSKVTTSAASTEKESSNPRSPKEKGISKEPVVIPKPRLSPKYDHKVQKRQHHGQMDETLVLGEDGGGKYRCFCKYQCNSKYLMKRHILTTAQRKMFQCLRCPSRFIYFGHLKRHMSEVHRSAAEMAHYVRGCTACGDIFMTRELYQHHPCRACRRKRTGATVPNESLGKPVSHEYSTLKNRRSEPEDNMDVSSDDDEQENGRPSSSLSSASSS